MSLVMIEFKHFKKKEQEAINDEYQQDFPNDEKKDNDLIMIPEEQIKTCLKKSYLKTHKIGD